VGLSLGITAQLSNISKLVLIITMFVGRVGILTLLVIIIRQSKQLHYSILKKILHFKSEVYCFWIRKFWCFISHAIGTIRP
jgi:hypothetical protein